MYLRLNLSWRLRVNLPAPATKEGLELSSEVALGKLLHSRVLAATNLRLFVLIMLYVY
ncbi:hypothetical protein RSOL_523260 [Rhizoctonia solani AG-3 Rhs1AP]|uniref:Uncharacterized protein n=1 Tax=Rhizoctonia solani AG-3 Rhs1AP TaxID=1086054 RepID=X8JX02_9AGAM|nr:hypothetical protein RSOL_523260 [Rhizoctonia solani AG-3 Rhs1AP]